MFTSQRIFGTNRTFKLKDRQGKSLKKSREQEEKKNDSQNTISYHHCVRSENWMFTSQRISGTNNTYKTKHKQQNKKKTWEQEKKWNESQNTFL